MYVVSMFIFYVVALIMICLFFKRMCDEEDIYD
jgi:hypothetical protein